MKNDVIALWAWKREEHTCLFGCQCTQSTTQIHGQVVYFEVVDNWSDTIIRKSGSVDFVVVLVA